MEVGVNHFAVDVHVPMSIPRRLLAWWAAQIKHVLPPTIFFFVGFNLILWTKHLILKEHGIEFSGFLTATFAALLIGKAVLVTDNLPFMHRSTEHRRDRDRQFARRPSDAAAPGPTDRSSRRRRSVRRPARRRRSGPPRSGY